MARWLEARPVSGFYSSPPTLIVPLGEDADVLLENANSCRVVSQAPAAVQVVDLSFLGGKLGRGIRFVAYQPIPTNHRLLILRGVAETTTTVRAIAGNGQVYAELRVIVTRIKRWKLKFHFVEDSAHHRTRRAPENFEPVLPHGVSVANVVDAMNRIYRPQAAIEMVSLGTSWASFFTDLGTMILDRTASTPAVIPAGWAEWNYIRSRNDRNANLNIYFVWRVEQSDRDTRRVRRLFTADSADALTETPGNTCIFEDDMPGDCFIPSLCHETGHSLGCDDLYADSANRRVMYGYTSPNHPQFTLAEVQTMRGHISR